MGGDVESHVEGSGEVLVGEIDRVATPRRELRYQRRPGRKGKSLEMHGKVGNSHDPSDHTCCRGTGHTSHGGGPFARYTRHVRTVGMRRLPRFAPA